MIGRAIAAAIHRFLWPAASTLRCETCGARMGKVPRDAIAGGVSTVYATCRRCLPRLSNPDLDRL